MSHANTTLTDEESVWITQLAGRLHLIRTDTAAATPAQRREYLQEEVKREFKNVPAANRKRFLEALLARFPVAGQVATAVPIAAAPPPAPETPAEALRRLLAAMPQMPPEQRAEVTKIFLESELGQAGRAAPALAITPESQRALGLAADATPRLERLVQMAGLLVEALGALDAAALKTLGDLSPRSALLKRPEEFRKSVAAFLTGQTESLDGQVRAMTGLLGALLAGLLGGGKGFERKHVATFSPEKIMEVVVTSGKGGRFMGPSTKELCWEKYEELAQDYLKPGFIDRKIKDSLGEFVAGTVKPDRAPR